MFKRRLSSVLIVIISGIMLLSLCIALGLIVVFSCRFLYYANIDKWHLEWMSGLSKEEIKLNFDALMKWCSPFYTQPLSFPTLPMSEGGAQHFAECKVLFNRFILCGAISAVILPFIYVTAFKKKKPAVFFGAAGMCAGFITVILSAFAIDFGSTFSLFHKIMFDNDLWLFDSSTDPIINILPHEYFLMCAIIISAVILLGLLFTLLLGGFLKRHIKKDVAKSNEIVM